MRRLIATTALATTALLLAGCNPGEAPVANDSVEPAMEPVVNMVDDGNAAVNVSAPPPPEPTTDGSDDRISGD